MIQIGQVRVVCPIVTSFNSVSIGKISTKRAIAIHSPLRKLPLEEISYSSPTSSGWFVSSLLGFHQHQMVQNFCYQQKALYNTSLHCCKSMPLIIIKLMCNHIWTHVISLLVRPWIVGSQSGVVQPLVTHSLPTRPCDAPLINSFVGTPTAVVKDIIGHHAWHLPVVNELTKPGAPHCMNPLA